MKHYIWRQVYIVCVASQEETSVLEMLKWKSKAFLGELIRVPVTSTVRVPTGAVYVAVSLGTLAPLCMLISDSRSSLFLSSLSLYQSISIYVCLPI